MRVAACLGCGLVLLVFLPGCAADRAADIVACRPGATLAVGCNQACGLGSCTGDPSIRVCDGTTPTASCTEGTRLVEVDDSPAPCASSCPIAVVTCPASGLITVVPITLSSISACDWGVEERGDALPVDAGARPSDAELADPDAGDADVPGPSDADTSGPSDSDAPGPSDADTPASDAQSDAASADAEIDGGKP